MAKFWTKESWTPACMEKSLNPVTGWPSFGHCHCFRRRRSLRLNPVTGWPSFGLLSSNWDNFTEKVLILLLDGQVLDFGIPDIGENNLPS